MHLLYGVVGIADAYKMEILPYNSFDKLYSKSIFVLITGYKLIYDWCESLAHEKSAQTLIQNTEEYNCVSYLIL